ncbi:hypothetical protein PYWP30_00087 [Pyrobaculum sp. WP30]|nr:hypothetical protein PYWP30_00087 [Pyrobaculum sp. WP30]
MHKRRHTVKLDGRRVAIDGKEIDLTGLRPIDLMLAALAYGIGIRYIDKTGEPYEMECEVDGYNVTCRAKCRRGGEMPNIPNPHERPTKTPVHEGIKFLFHKHNDTALAVRGP